MIKYPKTPYSPWSDSYANEDRVIQNMDNFIGKTISVTEKIDGSNTLIHNGKVYGRSVTAPSEEPWMGIVKKYHAHKSLAEPSYLFYGEDIFGIHSIEYNPVKPDETFWVFAILDMDDMNFLAWLAVKQVCKEVGFLTVPEIYGLTIYATHEELKNTLVHHMDTPSSIGKEKEGLVIRTFGEFKYTDFANNVCKMVRPNHVQTDEHWRRNWKPCAMKET